MCCVMASLLTLKTFFAITTTDTQHRSAPTTPTGCPNFDSNNRAITSPRPFALKPALMSGLGLTGDLNIIACWEHDRPGTISPAQATPALLKSLRTSDYCVELVLVGNKSAWWISKNDKTQWKSHRFSFMAFAKPCSALIKNIDARYGVSRGCRQWGCDKMVNTKTNRMHAAKPDAMIALEEVRLSFQL